MTTMPRVPRGHHVRAASLAALLALAGCAVHTSTNDSGMPAAETALWGPDSQSVDVTCFEYFQGSMRFRATRDQLSAEQLALLASLQTIDASDGCVADGMECTVTVTQANGGTMALDAIEGNPACGQPRKVISYLSFEPFRKTLGCQLAKNLTLAATGAPKPVPADPRCYNGLFTSSAAATIAVTLDVSDAATPHHLELDDCDQPGRASKLRFAVSDGADAIPLAVSTAPASAGADGTCASADLTFPHAGPFNLTVSVEGGAMPAGDFFLRFY